MAVWEQLQDLSDSQLLTLCQKYNVTALLPSRMNRYWLTRRLHVAIVTEQARRRARQAVYEARMNDRSAGSPVRGYRRRRYRNVPTYLQRYRGGDELHFERSQSEEEEDGEEDEDKFKLQIRERVEDDEEEQEQRFQYNYESSQHAQQAQQAQEAQEAEQAHQQQEIMLQDQQRQRQQQQQQQQEQKEQMRLLQLQQLHQQRQLQHLEHYLQQLEGERQHLSDCQRADQEVPATLTYQQQLEQMQQYQDRPPELPHAVSQEFPQELAQPFPHNLQPELESQEDLSSTELLPQRTMIDLSVTGSSGYDHDPEEETDYLTASSGIELQQEREVRTVNYLTSEQLKQIMNEKQMMLDNYDCHLAKVFSRARLVNELENIGDAPAAAHVPLYQTRQRRRGFWRQMLHVFRFRAGNKGRIQNLRYTILCCALAVCTYVGAKMLK